MKYLLQAAVSALILITLAPGTALADRMSMVLVTCEPGVPYFSVETLIIDGDSVAVSVVGGNGLQPLRAMIGNPVTCIVGTHTVHATLLEFHEANFRRGIETAKIVVTVDEETIAELDGTHFDNAGSYNPRARVEVYEHGFLRCQSEDWTYQDTGSAGGRPVRQGLLCTETLRALYLK